MPALDDILKQKLLLLQQKHQRRVPVETAFTDGVRAKRGGREFISFSGNDYLGLSHHPRVIDAAQAALGQYGAGAGASRLVTGEHPLYAELEALLAAYHGSQAACVFGSGYLTNIGVLPALAGAGDLIVADKFVHASMLDGARLSGADFMRFAHNNTAHCRMILEANRAEHQQCLILTESVFSMDGDRAPMAELAALAREFDAWLMVDGAHELANSRWQMANEKPSAILMGTLSKAAGSYGGYVCGSRTLAEYLKTAARSVIYSTALPPAVLAASIEALHIMHEQPELRAKPLEHARLFTSLLGLPEAQSAIVPIRLGDSERALAASARLAEGGYLVTAIRPPTVPEHTARLRFTFSAWHAPQHIEAVAAMIKKEGWLCES